MSRRSWVVCVAAVALVVGVALPSSALGFAHPKVVSANPADTTPHVRDGSVLAIASIGNRVYVGGTFSTVVNAGTSSQLPRGFLFAWDRTTGKVATDFVPVVDGAVETIAPAPGGNILVGGRFKTVNGAAQRSLAVLTPAGVRVTTFKAKTNGYVTKAVVRGNRLLVGGRFSTADAVARANLAAFDATTGALDTAFTIGATEGRVKSTGTVTQPAVVELDANAAGTRMVVLGNFRQVGGQPRMQIAMIDLTTNTVSPWSTTRFPNGPAGSATAYQCGQSFETSMRDVEFSADGAFFVVVLTGGPGDKANVSLCDSASRWETSGTAGARETWRNCTGGDTLYSVAVTTQAGGTGGAVYVGGHQRWLDNCGGRDSGLPGSFSAEGIGAIDAVTGRAIRTWNPGRTRGVGAEELVADATGLWVGSDTESLGGEFHGRIGLFPLN